MAEQNANNVNITGGTISGVAGFGDVSGPASSTDNAIARFDSTTGKLLQNSVVTVGDTGAVTGVTTFAASTSVTTPIVQATSSAGLALRNSAGTSQISMGAGGGDNVTIAVSTNLNGTNAQIDISPTGTGHVHIKPSGSGAVEIAPTSLGTINNMSIGATTASTGRFSDLTDTGLTATRVTYAGTGGNLVDSANLTFNGTTLVANDLTDSSLTAGRVNYNGTGGNFVDSANLTFDGTTLTAAGLSDSGNLTFTGTGNRIRGDFSNATLANRVAFQTTITNGGTRVNSLPNGTSLNSSFDSYNNSDPTNAAYGRFGVTGATEVTIQSAITGTGTYLPLTMFTGGSEKLRLDTSGNLGIGTSSLSAKLTVNGGTGTSQTRFEVSTTEVQEVITNAAQNAYANRLADAAQHIWKITSTEQMRINSSGAVGIGTSSPQGKLTLSNAGASGLEFFVTAPGGGAGTYIQSFNRSGGVYVDTFYYATAHTWRTSASATSMVLDSSGNVGIGTSSPGAYSNQTTLAINGTTYGRLDLMNGGTVRGYLYGGSIGVTLETGGALPVMFATNGTERMRITSTGDVGIGTSSPSQKLDVNGLARLRFSAGTGAGTWLDTTGNANRYFVGTDSTTESWRIFDSVASAQRIVLDSSGNVGIGATANASALLDVQSTTKGVRMPNMTTTQKNAISSPAAGLMVFDTTLAKLCVYSGSAWQTVTSV
jgi:hypothetical protein